MENTCRTLTLVLSLSKDGPRTPRRASTKLSTGLEQTGRFSLNRKDSSIGNTSAVDMPGHPLTPPYFPGSVPKGVEVAGPSPHTRMVTGASLAPS